MQPTAWGNSWGDLFKPGPAEVSPWEIWTWREWRLGACTPWCAPRRLIQVV